MAYNAYYMQQPHRQPHYQHPPNHPNNDYGGGGSQSAPTYTHPLNPLNPLPQTTSYHPLNPTPSRPDASHKGPIHTLKVLSRTLSLILSIATFVPLAMTLVKYFQTRNETIYVDGEYRTAWATDTQTWYTYLYFAVAFISLVLNAGVLASYCCCRGKSRAAKTVVVVKGCWSAVQHGGEIVVWAASVVIYRIGREPDAEGRFTDLWGWTCSPAAEAIQGEVDNVDFGMYCTVQVSLSVFRRLCCRLCMDTTRMC